MGSKPFFDYLRKSGVGSVDKFMKISEKPSWNKSITLVNIGNRKRQDAFNYEGESFKDKIFDWYPLLYRAKTELQKISTTSCEKNPRKNVRLNSDREYLKQLEAALAQQQDGIAGDVVLRYIDVDGKFAKHWIFV